MAYGVKSGGLGNIRLIRSAKHGDADIESILGPTSWQASKFQIVRRNSNKGHGMWEYKLIETLRTEFESRLNELGAQGWELVHFQYNPLTADVIGVVKRRKEQ